MRWVRSPGRAPTSTKGQQRCCRYLKVKIKSLAAESKIIRLEEKKLCRNGKGSSPVRAGLYLHRTNDVRNEARSALIAYGFLRGRTYKQIEPSAKSSPNWKRIQTLIEKYGPPGRSKHLEAWKSNCKVEHEKETQNC